jgi:tight adherence protein B
MDYKTYHFSWLQIAGMLLQAVLMTGIIAYLFYGSFCGMVLVPVLFVIGKRRKKENCIAERKRFLHGQFLDSLKIVSTCLMSGMSMENAWKEASKEMLAMHGKESIMYQELEEMKHLVATNVPMEKVLIQFAYRSGVEDIISFAEVFEYGKRSGANWRKLICDTALRMEEKYETEKQIRVMLAEKKMEQKIMSVIPLGIILFLRLTSKDYMDVLYGNPFGVICMTICLMGYGVALFMAEKIMKVQV